MTATSLRRQIIKRFTILSVAAMFVCGAAFGADEPGPNYEHLKPMEWMIGTWGVELVAPEDAPNDALFAVKKGDAIKFTIKFKWGLSKSVIESEAALFVNEVLLLEGKGLSGWAAEKKQIIGSGFDTIGGRFETAYTIVDENTIQMKQREVAGDGMITNVTITMTRMSEDIVKHERKNISVGGVEMPDEPPGEFKRIKK